MTAKPPSRPGDPVDAVVIGRNEGARLMACLASLRGQVRRLVYVDSGSTDGSVPLARSMGAEVVTLDLSLPFTAARARNAGLAALADDPPGFVQMVDGDCEVDAGWLAAARAAFSVHPQAVVVCGRRRERFPAASVYNALADREWDTPVGPARACGGDALLRYAAVQAVGGYRADLIAGEEPELCLRLRAAGGEVWRIAAEMTLHDAALLRFGQWWRRSVRAGHAFAEGAALHGAGSGVAGSGGVGSGVAGPGVAGPGVAGSGLAGPGLAGSGGHWVAETRRAVIWGMAVPLASVLGALVSPLALLLLLAYPAQVVRLARRGGWAWAMFSVLGKFAEARGVAGYWLGRWRGQQRGLIEYK